MAELHQLTATELAALVRSGKATSREVVDAHLARIAAVNGRANAVTVVLGDAARAAADEADRRRRKGLPLGPLDGVPFTVKENLDCQGSATTHGVPALRDALPYVDAPIVARMRGAGAIPIGRGNLSEMGLRLCTENPLRGRTQNPRSPRATSGGSSGGDAVAVATGMAPIGLGTDIGGSLRVPAHCAGVFALKPTTGRIPHAASLPPEDYGMAAQTMLAPGPLARSVADLALCLSVLAGRDRRDPRSVDVPLVGARLAPEDRRVALVMSLPGSRVAPDALAAVARAGAILASLGWNVDEATPPEVPRVCELWHKLVATDLAVVMPLMEPVVSPALFDHVMRLCRAAKVDEVSNNRLHEERSRLMRAWSGFFAEYPVVIGPNLTCAPWAVGADLAADTGLSLLEDATRFILPANALGLPVVAVPMDGDGGQPTSLQIYADLWREDLCLEVAEILERHGARVMPIDPAGG